MKMKKQSYIHGSAAKKLDYNIYEQNQILKDKKKERGSNKQKVKMILHVAICCTLALISMYRYSLLTEMNYDFNKTYNEYNKLKNENISLKVEIEKQSDLFKIRNIAEEKLGMQSVKKEQVVYVKVPNNDFVICGENIDNGETSLKNVIASKLGKLKQYI